MKHSLPFATFFLILINSFAQPTALRSDIQVKYLMNARLNSIKMAKDPLTQSLYFNTADGSIYKIIIPASGQAYDTLMFTVADHGTQYVQGIAFHDSVLYVSGNNNKDSSLTTAHIAKGKLKSNGTRIWTTIATSVPYPTSWKYYHLMSGMIINIPGDTLLICSGARTDHGEVQDRNGQFPNAREIPLTTKILCIPTSAQNIILQNDSAWLASNGYIFAHGVRNTFDMAYDANGHLFGTENSGDRDQPDELNWLQKNHHYGFPWVMGGVDNPQQFSSFNPSGDLLINHNCLAYQEGYFLNDPAYPQKPAGLVLTPGVRNFGPDADKFRDSITGKVKDASDLNIYISSFSSHRAPGGLVFDNANAIGSDLAGGAFMVSWTPGGDSLGNTSAGDVGPFVDPGEDLVHIKLIYNNSTKNYDAFVTDIVTGFSGPVDTEIIDNKIFVMENGYMGTPKIWEILLPGSIHISTGIANGIKNSEIKNYPNPCSGTTNLSFNSQGGKAEVCFYEIHGLKVKTLHYNLTEAGNQNLEMDLDDLNEGVYFYTLKLPNFASGGKIVLLK
jgi:hypothetical protein